MGLFNKKEKSANLSKNTLGLPELPKLPELPPLPPTGSHAEAPQKPNALPRFPSGYLGDKFSQSTIKDAVSGGKGGDVVDEFEQEIQKTPLPDQHPMKKMPPKRGSFEEQSAPPRYDRGDMEEPEEPEEEYTPSTMSPTTRRYAPQKAMQNEPVFIRLDKFEDSMDTFEKIKKQMSGVDRLLNEVKSIKEREDKELEDWKSKLDAMKNQIEKIDKDIFSKIE